LVDVAVTIGAETQTLPLAYEYIEEYVAITLDSDTVKINLSPFDGGGYSYTDNLASVRTNCEKGYSLSISTNDNTDNNLNHLSLPASIDPTSGTWAAKAVLSNNSWGFTLTASPTASASIWSAVPTKTSPLTIKSTNVSDETTLGDQTTVYYGVKADFTAVSGIYKTVVVYTAMGNI
jgi:hypothetical protein